MMKKSVTMLTKGVLSATLLACATSTIAVAADVTSAKFESKFYKEQPLFSTYAKETEVRQPIEHFGPDAPPAKPDPKGLPFEEITLKDQGQTDNPVRLWTGDILMDLDKFQALKMTPKAIGGSDYLFIEAGGFSAQNPVGWWPPLIVMKRAM